MSDEPAGPVDHGVDHDADDHGADLGHDDDAHAEEPLGPLDVPRWAAGVGGVLIAIFVAACFGYSTGAL
jgi:hypothetical protein